MLKEANIYLLRSPLDDAPKYIGYSTNVKQSSTIIRCCKKEGAYKSAGGFCWEYKKNIKDV